MPAERRYRIDTIPMFRQDYKSLRKKHYDMDLLRKPFALLMDGDTETMRREYRDHALKGNWQGFREFHVQGDWLVIYYVDGSTVTLVMSRTGSHDELFGAKMGRTQVRAMLNEPRTNLSSES